MSMYVKNAWYVAAWAHELAAQRPLGVRILDEPIVIWRTSVGKLTALEDRCVHRLAPLSLGRCEGERLRCMYHGLLYDPTGRVVEIPGQDRIGNSLRVRSYPVTERHGWIWVWMGNPEAADEKLVPPIGFSRPEFVIGHGQLDYAANARLVNDNLLDLSHAAFLHAETFRYGETWVRERPRVIERDRSLISERWIKGQGILGIRGAEPKVDTFFSYECHVPGVLLMVYKTYPLGTADALNERAPDFDEVTAGFSSQEGFSSQAVTPVTDKTCRYFYIMGRRRRAEESIYDMSITEKAFAEDREMIEAQQRNIDGMKEWRFMPNTADRGVILFNRLLDKLAHNEVAG